MFDYAVRFGSETALPVYSKEDADSIFYMLDQSTPQSVVPLAGTAFSISYHDFFPNLLPGSFVLPSVEFTNSNALGFPTGLGCVKDGLIVWGATPIVGLIDDFEAGLYALLSYDHDSETMRAALNGTSAYFTFSSVSLFGSNYPVFGGDTGSGPALILDSGIGIWDSQDTGGVSIFALNQDGSATSVLLTWTASNEELEYSGAGGFVVSGAGTSGGTDNCFTMKHRFLGDGVVGDGNRILSRHRNDHSLFGEQFDANYIDSILQDETEGDETAKWIFGGYHEGASANWISLSGVGLVGLIAPTFTYTDGVLTRIDYSTGAYKALTYNVDGTLDEVDVNSEYTKSFSYTDGVLTGITIA